MIKIVRNNINNIITFFKNLTYIDNGKSINDITLNITSHVVPNKYVLISRRKRMYIISCMKTNIDEYHRKL